MSVDIIGPEVVDAIIDQEIEEFDDSMPENAATLDAFQKARIMPREVTVNFSGGITQKCYAVTRSNGDYSVAYLPVPGYFALCVDSAIGPLDIGVHGPALACFGSV